VPTSAFRRDDKQYSRSITVPLRQPTPDRALLVDATVRGLQAIFKPGFNYARAEVMLLDLQTGGPHQGQSGEQAELDLDKPGPDRSRLMVTLDALNHGYGRSTVALASAGLAGPSAHEGQDPRRWVMKQALRTPDYTTRWADLPTARA